MNNYFKDFFFLILDKCDRKTASKLAITCRTAWEAYTSLFKLKKHVAGKYILKPVQAFVRDKALDRKSFVFEAPMSYGKTAAGLSVAFNGWIFYKDLDKDLTIIIVPAKAMGVWKMEAINMYGEKIYNPKSWDSPLLILSSQENNQHIKLLREKRILSKKTFAVLLSNNNCSDYYGVFDFSTKYHCIIVDEVHTSKKWTSYVNSYHTKNYYMLLTASPFYGHNLKTYYIKDEVISDQVPTIDFKLVKVDCFEYAPIALKERATFSDNEIGKYMNAVYKILKSTNDENFTLFIPGGDILDKSKKWIDKICEKLDRDLFIFKAESKKKFKMLDEFKESKNGLLVITHAQSEAINIICKGAIVIRPDFVNIERSKQMIGRVIRTTNKNKVVPVYSIMPSGYPYLKTLYSNAIKELGFNVDTENISQTALFLGFRLLNLYDPGLKKVKPIDIVVVCDNNFTNLNYDGKEISNKWLDKWIENKNSAFTDEQKKKILDCSFY